MCIRDSDVTTHGPNKRGKILVYFWRHGVILGPSIKDSKLGRKRQKYLLKLEIIKYKYHSDTAIFVSSSLYHFPSSRYHNIKFLCVMSNLNSNWRGKILGYFWRHVAILGPLIRPVSINSMINKFHDLSPPIKGSKFQKKV